MARRGRPASETHQPVRYSSSQLVPIPGDAGAAGPEDKDDLAPIFSLSKSSMDVVMATGPPHKRDPAWTRMDLRRSHSTNTHSEPDLAPHKKLHSHLWQHVSAANNYRLPLNAQNVGAHSPPAVGERWPSNWQRWSQCSSSTHSRSSTPDTVVWNDRTTRPSSLTMETINSPVTDSIPASPPTNASPFLSPLQTPTSPPEGLQTSSSFIDVSTHQQKDLSSPTPSPPLQAHASSPVSSISPSLPQLTSTEAEGLLENTSLFFTFPSPFPSSVRLAEGGAGGDPGRLAGDVVERPLSPSDTQLSEDGGVRSPAQMLSHLTPNSPMETQESGASVRNLERPWQPVQICPTGRRWRSLLVSSVSDSQLGDCCRCNWNSREDFTKTPKGEVFKEEGTMTSQLELVDAAVQTVSPIGSLWGLTRNVSTSNMGSHSILGSPPGSRLNLKSSVGSHSNLVSPSSSMFPVSSEEEEEEAEEERQGDDQTCNSPPPLLASSHGRERRRSCLKIQGEESDDLARRGSMKQVQWDENGMTWDIHGASPDPEVLSTAIRKHLEVHNSPRPARRPSKKKRAPKPPVTSNVVKAVAPEPDASVSIAMPACVVDGESEDKPDGVREAGEEGGGKKEATEEPAPRKSKAEGEAAKAEEEVCGRGGAGNPESPSGGSGPNRKKSVIRSLRRPGWCGGSRRADD